MIASERLYLTKDRRRVVREGDAAAAFLLAAKGCEIPREYMTLLPPAPTAQPVTAGSPVNPAIKESALPKLRRR